MAEIKGSEACQKTFCLFSQSVDDDGNVYIECSACGRVVNTYREASLLEMNAIDRRYRPIQRLLITAILIVAITFVAMLLLAYTGHTSK